LKHTTQTKIAHISDYDKNNLNLADNEKNIILIALQKNKGNITKTALDLGIDRTTLIRKKSKYSID
jgi:transcriptional regulator with PAS, ATPase and Fis domain